MGLTCLDEIGLVGATGIARSCLTLARRSGSCVASASTPASEPPEFRSRLAHTGAMFDRFLRRGKGARYRTINESGGISKDGPAPSEEPLSTQSVLRALGAMPELDWVRLAAVEHARQADPDSIKNEHRIYRAAYASADRHGARDHLKWVMDTARQEATELARVAAGEEALAAHARFEAVVSGRGGLLADPSDAPAVGRYLGFVDAATNAVSAAALRPHVSRRDFSSLWQGYTAVVDFTTTSDTEANASMADVESNPTDADRMLFGPSGPEVVSLLLYLDKLNASSSAALLVAHQTALRAEGGAVMRRLLELLTEGGRRGLEMGAITSGDVTSAKRLAEEAADRALAAYVDAVVSRSGKPRDVIETEFGPALRAAANVMATSVLVLPFLDDDEAAELWAPWTTISPKRPWSAA